MPRGNRTGPMGLGPMTGRGAGYCAGYGMPGYANPLPGMGFGGRQRGWRHMFYATGLPGWMRYGAVPHPYPQPSSENEKQALRNQAEALQQELDFIKKRLEEIDSES